MRRVQPEADDSLSHCTPLGFTRALLAQRERGLIGVRAVHEVAKRVSVGLAINVENRPAKRGPVGEPPVGTNCERDHDINAGRTRSSHDALSLARIAHGDRGDAVDSPGGERPHLPLVISLCFVRGHRLLDAFVIARAHAPTNRHVEVGRMALGRLSSESGGVLVHLVESLRAVTEQRTPVGVRPPGRSIKQEGQPVRGGKFDKRAVILGERCATGLGFEQSECGKLGQHLAETLVESGLDAAVCDCEAMSCRRGAHVVVRHSPQPSAPRSARGYRIGLAQLTRFWSDAICAGRGVQVKCGPHACHRPRIRDPAPDRRRGSPWPS